MNVRKLGIGAVIAVVALCAIGALVFGNLGNLFGGGNQSGANPPSGGSQAQGDLGQLYVSDQIDNQGCPVGQTSQFASNQPIYAGLERSRIPAGTEIFMRLYRDDQPLEDSPPIRADSEMNTCVWFEFRPSSGQGFDPGNYTVEAIVNGNRAGQLAFGVGGQGIANTGSAELGRVVTTSSVTSDGCPTGEVREFYTDESIYLSVEESFIPAGTDLFARLNYAGEPVEDTDEIRTERDRESCVWFVFEPRGGFTPGRYTVELFINGSLVESLPVDIR